MAGRDFSFWTRVLRVAGSLVTRQRYLPGVQQVDGDYHARWQPIWLGDDSQHLDALAAQMPAAARALISSSDIFLRKVRRARAAVPRAAGRRRESGRRLGRVAARAFR